MDCALRPWSIYCENSVRAGLDEQPELTCCLKEDSSSSFKRRSWMVGECSRLSIVAGLLFLQFGLHNCGYDGCRWSWLLIQLCKRSIFPCPFDFDFDFDSVRQLPTGRLVKIRPKRQTTNFIQPFEYSNKFYEYCPRRPAAMLRVNNCALITSYTIDNDAQTLQLTHAQT